jgi:selenocysteine-specific elongation factor
VTVVVGTAGHIDHGKTSLLRALTGIDADRLPDEQRRGMTLDVGYAHLLLPNGRLLDFVDVPGHDRLVGNMLVGAGEIDAAMLVVAADDGPRAQTFEHLALLDAYGIEDGLAVITKSDLAPPERVAVVRTAVEELLATTSLAAAVVVPVSATTGEGLASLVEALMALEVRVARGEATRAHGARTARLAIDRVFTVRGRGTVVTGSLRGGGLAAGESVRILPGAGTARIREVQVHGTAVNGAAPAGRTALNLAGAGNARLSRGQVLSNGPAIEVSDRLLVALRAPALRGDEGPWPPRDGTAVRLHLGTGQVPARIGRGGREGTELAGGRWSAVLRLEEPVATAVGDRFVLRRPSPGEVVAGGVVLDPLPPVGLARRRITADRVSALDAAVQGSAEPSSAVLDALVELHGALQPERARAVGPFRPSGEGSSAPARVPVASDLASDLAAAAMALVAARTRDQKGEPGPAVAEVRTHLAGGLHRAAGIAEPLAMLAADEAIAALVSDGRLARDGDRLRDPSVPAGPPPELVEAMDRLEAMLSTPAPPALADAARAAGCPPSGTRAMAAAGRIVRLDAELAWAAPTYRRLAAEALAMARRGPLSPAAFRDATGTSRRYVLAILEDLDRRGILQRGPDGHRPGPRAQAATAVGPGAATT